MLFRSLTVDTRGSAQATALTVYQGSQLTNLVRRASAGPGEPDQTSVVAVYAQMGDAFAIQVDGSGQGTALAVNGLFDAGSNSLVEISLHPRSQSVEAGQSVTFTVEAIAYNMGVTSAPAIQWQFNGANIPGATSASYTIASAQPGDAGTYRALLNGSVGTAPAFLTLSVTTGPATGYVLSPANQFLSGAGYGLKNFWRAGTFCFRARGTPATRTQHATAPSGVLPALFGPSGSMTSYVEFKADTIDAANGIWDTVLTLSQSNVTGDPSCTTCNNSTPQPQSAANDNYTNGSLLSCGRVNLCPCRTDLRVRVLYGFAANTALCLPNITNNVVLNWRYNTSPTTTCP